MKKSLFILFGTTSLFFLSGCATLFGGGSEQKVSIQTSTPAVVTIGHTEDGETIIDPKQVKAPAVVTVKRENKDLLVKTENGKQKVVKKKLNPWFFGDVLALSPISTTTDAVSGAMWKYDDQVDLDK